MANKNEARVNPIKRNLNIIRLLVLNELLYIQFPHAFSALFYHFSLLTLIDQGN
jgi:hypothetical protein